VAAVLASAIAVLPFVFTAFEVVFGLPASASGAAQPA
jgi:hypothetical protein